MSLSTCRRTTLVLALTCLLIVLATAGIRTTSRAVAEMPIASTAVGARAGHGSALSHRWPDGSRVTISQTTNLIHQVVRVSWSGMKPTTYVGSIDNGGGTTDAVDVLQCWGLHPRREDCWYAPSTMAQPYRADYTAYTSWTVPGDPAETQPYRTWWSHQISPYFAPRIGKRICAAYGCAHDVAGITAAPDFSLLPTNEQLGQTSSAGTGSVGFEVRTRDQLPSLGCDDTHPCSLVVVPTDHVVTGPQVSAADSAASTEFAFRLTASHWAGRAVFPLRFARQSATCPFASTQTQITSSEAGAAAIVRWQPALCTRGFGGLRVAAALTTEPDSVIRSQLAAGLISVGVLDRPDTSTPTHPLAVAPIVASGTAISFVIDDARTGAPVRTLRLNARLVAKLLTESYCSFVCGTDPSYPADPNVKGNPELFWQDPELAHLNPGVTFFSQGTYAPEVEYFDSDAFYTLTRWINADPTARAWLDGKADPWGMRVNKRYRHWALPVSAPVKLDPWKVPKDNPRCVPASAGDCVFNGYDVLDLKYQFVNSMDSAAQNVTVAQSSDASNNQPNPTRPGQTTFVKVAPASYPNRAILGIMTTSQAATLGLPMASLQNGRGQFVAPTSAGLRAGLSAMTADRSDGAYDLDPRTKAAGVYPLTMVTSIVATTSGLDHSAAANIAAIIRYAGGPGRVSGTGLGQLPAGYIAVDATMRNRAATAAAEVQDQSGRQRAPSTPPVSPPAAAPSLSDAPAPPAPSAVAPTDPTGSLPTATSRVAPTPTGRPTTPARRATPSPHPPVATAQRSSVAGAAPAASTAASPPAAAVPVAGTVATPLAMTVSADAGPNRLALLIVLTLGLIALVVAGVLAATVSRPGSVGALRRLTDAVRITSR